MLLTAIGLEHVGPMERYSLRARIPGLLMTTVGTFSSFLLITPFSWAWQKIGLGPLLIIPLWTWLQPLGAIGRVIEIALLVVVADFLIYWRHRAEHVWFWRIHVVHHAPRELHAANDIAHPTQVIYNFAIITIPMSLIQIDSHGTPFFVAAIVLLASMYIHSPVQWHFGPLRKLIVDNRFHRIHHSLEERHFDKNFGILLSVWDRMFGTAYDPLSEWPAVGVAGVNAPQTLKEYMEMPLTLGRGNHASRESAPSSSDRRLDQAI